MSQVNVANADSAMEKLVASLKSDLGNRRYVFIVLMGVILASRIWWRDGPVDAGDGFLIGLLFLLLLEMSSISRTLALAKEVALMQKVQTPKADAPA